MRVRGCAKTTVFVYVGGWLRPLVRVYWRGSGYKQICVELVDCVLPPLTVYWRGYGVITNIEGTDCVLPHDYCLLAGFGAIHIFLELMYCTLPPL